MYRPFEIIYKMIIKDNDVHLKKKKVFISIVLQKTGCCTLCELELILSLLPLLIKANPYPEQRDTCVALIYMIQRADQFWIIFHRFSLA